MLHHAVVSHDVHLDGACVFRDGVLSFDPISDRSRDLSHPWYESFCPNPRIRMQKWPRSENQISWDPAANSADLVTFANDWLSFSPHHNHRQTFPALRKSSQSLNWPSFIGSRGIAPYANAGSTAGATHVLHIHNDLLHTASKAGSVSWIWNSPRRQMFPTVPSRANRAYSRRDLCVDLKHLQVVFEAGKRSSSTATSQDFEWGLTCSWSSCPQYVRLENAAIHLV